MLGLCLRLSVAPVYELPPVTGFSNIPRTTTAKILNVYVCLGKRKRNGGENINQAFFIYGTFTFATIHI